MTENTQALVRDTYERCVAAGELIFDEGDEGDCLYIVQSGEVEVTRCGPTGRQTVSRLAAGDFFGEMSVVLGERRTARAVATHDTRLLELDSETLEAMCMERPEIGIRILHRLTERLIDAERRLSILGIDDLVRPLVRALVRRAEPHPEPSDEAGIRIPARLRELAEDAGLTLFEAHRALHQLLEQKHVRLLDDVLVARTVDDLSASVEPA